MDLTPDQHHAQRRFVRLLRAAHAGERAAALAYQGHARSVREPAERIAIRAIEAEEWAHRVRLGAMLQELGAAPAGWRELVFHLIGRTLSALCLVSGWYLPMYGAGWIEARNVQEYLLAAQLAAAAGQPGFAAELLVMAQCERTHEAYFRSQVRTHGLTRWLGLWPEPAPEAAPGLALPDAQRPVESASSVVVTPGGP